MQKMTRQETKRIAAPEWKKALAERADSRFEHRVIVDTSVVTVSNQNVRVQSASKGRPLSGGLNPKADYPAVEFGADRSRMSTYQRRSPNGGSHSVTRHTSAQLKGRNPNGYVFYPSAREMVPRIARLWVQTVVRTIATALEGKQE